LLTYCKSLTIPPAWNDVWISRNEQAHILCTGIDARKRKQYIYHPLWQEHQNLSKFDGLVGFAQQLAEIRKSVKTDMAKAPLSKQRVLATAVKLIDIGLIRVGNDAYMKSNKTYGATTLKQKHVDVSGQQVSLSFLGKSGKQREIDIKDVALARRLKECQELPGQRLFQYQATNGRIVAISSSDVNDYLKRISGEAYTAKTFRTWGGTVAALHYSLSGMQVDGTDTNWSKLEKKSVQYAARKLGNTVAVARKYYIHPDLLSAIASGTLPSAVGRARKGLSKQESAVLRMLKSK